MDPQRPIYPQRVRKKNGVPYLNGWPPISKPATGTIKNGSAGADLPPEGPKKKWLGRFDAFAAFRQK